MDGIPRAARPEDLPQLRRLATEVFMPGRTVTMGDLFPSLWCDENATNIRIVEENGSAVSQIGLWPSEIIICGHRIPSASMGAVCTREESRGKGYATALLMDSFRWCDELGIDLITISGGRGLYKTNECRSVGEVYKYTLNQQDTANIADIVRYRKAALADLPIIRHIYAAEPVRFSRTALDFERFFSAQTVAGVNDRALEVRILSVGGCDVAYLAFGLPTQPGDASVCYEYAGDRAAIASGIYEFLATSEVDGNNLCRVDIVIPSWDKALVGVLSAAGSRPHVTEPHAGTVFITNPVRLFGRLARYFRERVDDVCAAQLASPTATSDGRGLRLRVAGQAVSFTTRSEVIDLVFGTPEMAAKVASLPDELAYPLMKVFPLSFPNPECLNFI